MRPVIIALLCVTSVGCTIVSRPPVTRPQPTQLQTREFQTREYDTNDVKLVLKAVLNVLQDDGFVVKNAVPDLGLLTATKELNLTGNQQNNSRRNEDYWVEILLNALTSDGNRNRPARSSREHEQEIRTAAFKSIEVSVNVSELGRRCKVRANFQAKTLDTKGNPMSVQAVDDPKFYQDFFAKVDKGIFLQKQGF